MATQVEAPAPTENNQDTAPVAILNKVETSNEVTAELQPTVPRLFVQSKYVAAVRASDGAILSRGVAAQPGEVIELDGTGFNLQPVGSMPELIPPVQTRSAIV